MTKQKHASSHYLKQKQNFVELHKPLIMLQCGHNQMIQHKVKFEPTKAHFLCIAEQSTTEIEQTKCIC